ncbi:MAG: HlyD family efflux transporter periplasmic adaptor subunit [Bilifractor sp.]
MKKSIFPKDHKRKKRLITGISVITAAAVGGTLIYVNGKRQNVHGEDSSQVQSTTAQTGTVENTITGSGTLQTSTGSTIEVPSGLTYEEVLVESGDTVKAGDTLAKVSHSSVLTAMQKVQSAIDSLDAELVTLSAGETSTITSSVAGTVTAVNGAAGDSVSDIMNNSGAILTIAVGGDTSNTIDVTAADGTIGTMSMSVGSTVSVGTTLFTVSVGTDSTEYAEKIAERQELTAVLQKLTEISATDTITADEDGTIGNVYISASSGSTSSGTSSSGSTSSGTSSGSAASGTAAATSASGTSSSGSITATKTSLQKITAVSATGSSDESTETASAIATSTSKETDSTSSSDSSGSDSKISLRFDIGSSLTAPVAGAEADTTLAENDSYTSEVVWTTTADLEDGDDSNNKEITEFAEGTAYSASIRLTAEDGKSFGNVSFTDVPDGVTYQYAVKGSSCIITVNYPATQTGSSASDGGSGSGSSSSNGSGSASGSSSSSGNGSGSASGNSSSSGSGASSASGSAATSASGSGGSTSSASDTSSGSSADSTSSSDSTASSDSSTTALDSITSAYEENAFSMVDDSTMTMSVSVDELDINEVSTGQDAEVTVDAIDGKTFTGTVQSVSNTASSSGNGSAKYTVTISISKEDGMKAGMTASATIVVDSSENVVTIPVNALQEKGSETYVYTSVDSDGNLSGETEVETGLSDGDTVEITSGLSDGDTVYYEKTGNVSSSGSGSGGSAGGDMPSGDGGTMPSGDGGGMPSGGGDSPSGGGNASGNAPSGGGPSGN